MRLGALALATAAFGLTFALDPWQGERVSDLPLYSAYAALFFDDYLPYSGVGFEYPTLAAPVIAVPGLVSTELDGYRLAFACMAFAALLALAHWTGRLARACGADERAALLVVAGGPLLTGALIRTHFDLLPVLCVVAGLTLIARDRTRSGFVILGVGAAVKAFPLAIVPVAAVWLHARGRTRAAVEGGVLALVPVAAAVAVAVALSPSGAWDAVTYHAKRPVQIESMPATVLNAIEWAGGPDARPVESYKSDALEHPAAGAVELLFTVLLAGALLAMTLLARRVPDVRGLALGGLGAMAVCASLGKVLSPQFMVWLLPLVALAAAWRLWPLAICTAAAIAATMLWFPERYFDLVGRDEWTVAAVAFRNALLVAALVLLVRELLRASRAAAESQPQGRPREPRPAPR